MCLGVIESEISGSVDIKTGCSQGIWRDIDLETLWCISLVALNHRGLNKHWMESMQKTKIITVRWSQSRNISCITEIETWPWEEAPNGWAIRHSWPRVAALKQIAQDCQWSTWQEGDLETSIKNIMQAVYRQNLLGFPPPNLSICNIWQWEFHDWFQLFKTNLWFSTRNRNCRLTHSCFLLSSSLAPQAINIHEDWSFPYSSGFLWPLVDKAFPTIWDPAGQSSPGNIHPPKCLPPATAATSPWMWAPLTKCCF